MRLAEIASRRVKASGRKLAFIGLLSALSIAGALHFGFNVPSHAQTASPAGANACAGMILAANQSQPQALALQPIVPNQFSPVTDQIGADCMAWQTFIALNWAADRNNPGRPDPAAPPSSFGAPGSPAPTVWESFFRADQLFTGPQVGWNSPRPDIKQLVRVGKQTNTVRFQPQLSSIDQASGPVWLTNRWGQLVFYEVLVNQDAFEFIAANNLTSAAGQLACAQQAGANNRGGFALPAGGGGGNQDTNCAGTAVSYGQNLGAIEIKAAWTPLPADGSLNTRFKTARANLTLPNGSAVSATVGLVGLHIIHKVPGAPQFLWATFEHIDNSPDDLGGGRVAAPNLPPNPNNPLPRNGYTFFDPNCPSTRNCTPNQPPVCIPVSPTTPTVCSNYATPIQVTRVTPVDQVANSITGAAWGLMPSQSVFNYYRLINVMWGTNPVTVPPQSVTPLPDGNISPSPNVGIVANTTLETYVQRTDNCMMCHKKAAISYFPNPNSPTPSFASNYSFIYSIFTSK
jgi:hypothetical protein